MILEDVTDAGVQGECTNCTFARPAQVLLFPEPGCVSETTYRIYTALVVLIVVPAGFIAAVLWPLWLLSLQLGVVFAADDISDLMEELKPVNVPRWVKESEAGRIRGDTSEENVLWQAEVALPGAMLVETMFELSAWGSSMGAAIIGCWGFSLGLLPTAVYLDWTTGTAVLILVAALPLFVARQPAFVSTRCDRLLEQLNDISFLGDPKFKERCMELRLSFSHLNRGQGLGVRLYPSNPLNFAIPLRECGLRGGQFVVFETVINIRMLKKIAAVLMTTGWSLLMMLIAIGEAISEGEQIIDMLSDMEEDKLHSNGTSTTMTTTAMTTTP